MLPSTGSRRPRLVGRPLADLVAPTLGKVAAARGFAAADVVTAWPDIVGEQLAAISQPLSLDWGRSRRDQAPAARPSGRGRARHTEEVEARGGGALILRVENGFGLEIQHLAPVILERVNAYFGWRCAERLVIRQGKLVRKAEASRAAASPDPLALAKGRALTKGIADDELRGALARLAAEVLAKDRG